MLVRSVSLSFSKSGGCGFFLFKKPGDFSLNRHILKSRKKTLDSWLFPYFLSQNTDQYLISIGLLLIHWMLNVGIFILLFSTKNMLFDSDLRVIRILYLTKPDIEHLQTYKLNSTILPSLFPDSYKKLILMFPNIFASMVTVTIDNFKV